MTLRVAIVGCGKAAENHAAEIKRLAGVRFVAACDSEPLMAEQFFVRHGLEAYYTDFQALLREQKPDVVHIATPPQSHGRLATAAIEAGCHEFVEKPLAETSTKATDIVRTAQRHGRKLTVGWTYYFDPEVRRMRALISDGVIGDPVHLDALLAYDLRGNYGAAVMQNPSHWVHGLRGKLVQNNLDHLLSLLLDFMGEDSVPTSVLAWRTDASGYVDLVDELRFLLKGRTASAQVAFSCRARPAGHFLTVAGTKNTIRLNVGNQILTCDSTSRMPGLAGRLAASLSQMRQLASVNFRNLSRLLHSDFQSLPGFQYLLEAFYRSIEEDSETPIPYEHILRVSTWIDQIVDDSRDVRMVA
jgi:predicted dehydrogenase